MDGWMGVWVGGLVGGWVDRFYLPLMESRA